MVTEGDIQKKKEELREANYDDDEIELILSNYGVTKKTKGVKYNVVKNKITFNDYMECLATNSEKNISQNLIQAQKHKVYSITQEKIALSPFDDKRYLIPRSAETLPWGHYSI
nr:hypothetical protein [Rickettsia endosymbiont of Ceutorhynchus assimilis]